MVAESAALDVFDATPEKINEWKETINKYAGYVTDGVVSLEDFRKRNKKGNAVKAERGTQMELKSTTDMVKVILSADPKTRNNDNLLYIRFLDEYGRAKGNDYLHMTVIQFFANISELGVPTIETVGRCRRKLQEKNPELRANAEVTAFRNEREKMFREYARS
jgi:hypothetical protein